MTARTSELLAVELDKVGLIGMAKLAREDHFHDFLSPLDMPEIELVEMLSAAAMSCLENDDFQRQDKIWKLRDDVINGKYDADKAESDAWAKSPEGRATMGRLIRNRRGKG